MVTLSQVADLPILGYVRLIFENNRGYLKNGRRTIDDLAACHGLRNLEAMRFDCVVFLPCPAPSLTRLLVVKRVWVSLPPNLGKMELTLRTTWNAAYLKRERESL